MKIAFVINDITRIGGTEKITCTLSNTFDSNGHDITIISCHHQNENVGFHLANSIKVVYLDLKKSRQNRLARIFDYFSLAYHLKGVIERANPDVIICQSFPMTMLTYLVLNKQYPIIACEHTSYQYYSPFVRKLTQCLYRHIKYLVVINKTDQQSYNNRLSNVILIPNIVPEINALSKAKYESHKIVSVGRLEYHKGFDLLIKAIKPVFDLNTEWTLDIFGDGSERKRLSCLIKDLRLEDKVFLRGNCYDSQEMYGNYSIFVSPSRVEGFGLCLVEAAYYQLPLIAFDAPNGPKDILDNDNGILVDRENVSMMSDSISKLISNKKLWEYYMYKSERIVDDYKQETIYKKWEKLFINL